MYRAPGPQPRERFMRDNGYDSVRSLERLPDDLQDYVLQGYEAERKKLRWAYVWWLIPLGWHSFYLGRIGRGFLFLASIIIPLIWLVWWVIDALKMQQLISEANAPLTDRLLRSALAKAEEAPAAEQPQDA